MKLNLGCGISKLDGFINIDIDESLHPDKCWNFLEKWPIENESIDEIVMYHTIEHIPKRSHIHILVEAQRVLVPEGTITFTYPEFLSCVENWRTNLRGQREFWEATIYGRQSSPYDLHVCIMDTDEFCKKLVQYGFEITFKGSELFESYNSIVKAKKVELITYEQVVQEIVGDIHGRGN